MKSEFAGVVHPLLTLTLKESFCALCQSSCTKESRQAIFSSLCDRMFGPSINNVNDVKVHFKTSISKDLLRGNALGATRLCYFSAHFVNHSIENFFGDAVFLDLFVHHATSLFFVLCLWQA